MNKKCAIIVSVALCAVITAAGIGIPRIVENIQFSKDEKPLSDAQRKILAESFTPLEFTSKKEPKRVIDNTHPLNLLNYYGNEPVLDLWASIPDN